jgi:hypothetical protein
MLMPVLAADVRPPKVCTVSANMRHCRVVHVGKLRRPLRQRRELGHGGRVLLLVATGDRYVGPGLRETPGNAQADAAVAAGHQRNFALEIKGIHGQSLIG